MDGKPLLQAFTEPIQPDYIDSWENVPGNAGMHPPDMQEDAWAAQEALQQLIELGYVEAPGEDKQARMDKIKNETDFILSKVYAGSRRYSQAIEILERLHRQDPDAARYGLKLAHCYQLTGNIKELRRVIDGLRKRNLKEMPHLDYLEGILLLYEHKPRKSLQMLQQAEQSVAHLPGLHLQIGNVYNKMKRWSDAERAFKRTLEIDVNNAHAYHGLSVAYLRQYRYAEAADMALDAIALLHYFPEAHYHLGEILFHMKDYARAAQAFEVSVTMMPGYKKAHQWLIRIYEDELNDPLKAAASRQFIDERIKGTVTIVSGLPRSGTSMMMQMLEAGGMPLLADGLRQEDENNPKGYLEFEPVKKMAQDQSWLPEANGKAVKIISHFLQHLPNTYNYKIIFMQRELSEVLQSQQKMLGKNPNNYPASLADTFQKQLAKTESWLNGQPNIDVMYINYRDIIEQSEEQAENLLAFLGTELDLEKMKSVIDKNLYRNKH